MARGRYSIITRFIYCDYAIIVNKSQIKHCWSTLGDGPASWFFQQLFRQKMNMKLMIHHIGKLCLLVNSHKINLILKSFNTDKEAYDQHEH